MAAQTKEQMKEIVDAIHACIAENPNVRSISTDGTTTTFNSIAEMIALANYYEAKLATASKTRSMIRRIDMSNG